MKGRIDFVAYLFAGILFLYSGNLMYMLDEELVYPILTILCAGVMFISAFQVQKRKINCVKN